MLQEHAALLDVGLAYALKDICLNGWSINPAQAVGAAATLAYLAQQSANLEIQALANWAAGIAALTEGQMERAIECLDNAATQFEALTQTHSTALTQVSKLIALAMLGRYAEAIECGIHARDVLVMHGDELAAGKIEQNLGNIYFRRDCYQEAELSYRAARERFIAIKDQTAIIMAEHGLAGVLTWQHKFRAAAQVYERALAQAETAHLEVWQAPIERNLGRLALFQNRYDKALDYLERSRRRYASLNMPHETAIAEQELADAYLELNLIPEAVTIYDLVIPKFDELGLRFEQAWALAHSGRAYLLLDDYDKARDQLAHARTLFAIEGNAICEAIAALTEAQVWYAEGDYTSAAVIASQAELLFAPAKTWAWLLLSRLLQGDAARMLGQYDVAEHLLETTLRNAEQQMQPQIAQRCHTSLGLLAASTGNTSRAESAFRQAVALIEALRAPLPAEEFRTAFVADKLIPYTEMVRLCLADDTPRVVEALRYIERSRSRALVEMLGGAAQTLPKPNDEFEAKLMNELTELREELNWFYSQINRPTDDITHNPDAMTHLLEQARTCETAIQEITRQLQQHGDSPLIYIKPLDIDHMRQSLGSDTALVEYYSIDDKLLAFVVTNTSIDVIHNLGCSKQIETAVSQLRFQTDAMRHGSQRLHQHLPQLAKRAHHYLCQLYDLLLRPLEAYIADHRLVIVPHRELHYVPFHALHNGETYVIEQREVCYAPSASVLHRCLTHPERPFQNALLFGVPDELAPRVHDEVVTIAPLFPNTTLLLDKQATLNALYEHAPHADLVHLACHGQFRPDNPLFSALHLSDGWLTVRDAYTLDLHCGLVTLSACETGVNAVAPGDELIGMARGFFSAGAPSLLVSLWTVDDESTAALMRNFYSSLLSGKRPAAALRQAQLIQLNQHLHPFFWSPFVLLGRW